MRKHNVSEEDGIQLVKAMVNRYQFADRLVEIRKREKQSQMEFANSTGISEETIKNVEQGKQPLSINSALCIHHKYGYSLDYIYGLSDKAKKDEDKFFADTREMFKIEDDRLQIRIKATLYQYLKDRSSLSCRLRDKALTRREHQTLLSETAKKFSFQKSDTMYYGEIETSKLKLKLKVNLKGNIDEIDIAQ